MQSEQLSTKVVILSEKGAHGWENQGKKQLTDREYNTVVFQFSNYLVPTLPPSEKQRGPVAIVAAGLECKWQKDDVPVAAILSLGKVMISVYVFVCL